MNKISVFPLCPSSSDVSTTFPRTLPSLLSTTLPRFIFFTNLRLLALKDFRELVEKRVGEIQTADPLIAERARFPLDHGDHRSAIFYVFFSLASLKVLFNIVFHNKGSGEPEGTFVTFKGFREIFF